MQENRCQQTTAYSVKMSGVGLHTGQRICLHIHPAEPGHGVVFRRVDCTPAVAIPARLTYVGDTRLCTTLEHKGVKVGTVEHLLSALVGLGIDNVLIDVDGPEVPIMDGSASPFVFMLQSAGIRQQRVRRDMVVVHEPVEVHDHEGKSYCRLLPYSGFKLTVGIEFDHPVFDAHNCTKSICMGVDSYERDISRARTFGFVNEIDYLRQQNLAQGASLANAVGIDSTSVVNPEGLRASDEPVTHKLLDAIGDLSLFGYPICGEFIGYCSGHTMNKLLLDKLLSAPESWSLQTGS